MKTKQANKKLTIRFLIPFLENEDQDKEWELMEISTNHYSLLKGYSVEDVVMQHLPSETFWKSQVMYVSIDGYTEDDNKELVWEQVYPENVTEVKVEYNAKRNNAKRSNEQT